MLGDRTTIGTTIASPDEWVLTVTRLLNAALPLQSEPLSTDSQPVSATAQLLASSLYSLLERPHALYSTYYDLLTASADFQGRARSIATERSESGLRQSEYGLSWLAEEGFVPVWKRNSPATHQFLKLDLGVDSAHDRIARGGATVAIARGMVKDGGFAAEVTREVSVTASTTLRQLVGAINGTAAGVTAALSGKYLLLIGDSPGAGNAFQVLTSGAISRAWNFDPALYQPDGPSPALIYRAATDAVAGGTPPDGYYSHGSGTLGAAEVLTNAVGTLLDFVSRTDEAGLLTTTDPLLRDFSRVIQKAFSPAAAYGASSLTPWDLGFEYGADGLAFDIDRHLQQYAANPAGTRSAMDDLAGTLAQAMNDPIDSLHGRLEALRHGVLLGVGDALRDGTSLAEAIAAYAETLLLGRQTR